MITLNPTMASFEELRLSVDLTTGQTKIDEPANLRPITPLFLESLKL